MTQIKARMIAALARGGRWRRRPNKVGRVRTATQSIGRWAARGSAAFFAAFAMFQGALILGAPLGVMAWGGSSAVLSAPFRLASAAAAIYLGLAAAAMLVRSGDWGRRLPPSPFRWFNAFLTFQLALNTAANFASRSAPERLAMGAASAIGCCLCLAAFLFSVDGQPGSIVAK